MRGTSESASPHGQLADALRPWISLWLTIHFFALAICLAANLVSSELERRILKVLAPYTVGLHQDYGAVPLEMTRGAEIDYAHVFQVHEAGNAPDQWQSIEPPRHFASSLDHRWRSFEHWVAMAASEPNEDLIYMLFERCLERQFRGSDAKADGVRLLRRATLSYAADQARVAGELPVAELSDRTLFECRVVHLSGDRVKLLPVLESMRTSKSLASGSAASNASPLKDSPTEDRQ